MRNVFARSGLRKICPATGCLPLMYHVATESGSTCVQQPAGLDGVGGSPRGRRQSEAMRSETGKPVSAYSMAGCSVSLNVIVPKRCSTSSQPQTEPGTVTLRMPLGIPDPGPQLRGFHV